MYLGHLVRVRGSVSLPIIASLNGATAGGWVRFAKEIEAAGADAIELNTYSLSTDPRVSGAEVEAQLIELVEQVRASVKIPIAVKLSPQFTSLPNLVRSLIERA